jgi:hypothetical protein
MTVWLSRKIGSLWLIRKILNLRHRRMKNLTAAISDNGPRLNCLTNPIFLSAVMERHDAFVHRFDLALQRVQSIVAQARRLPASDVRSPVEKWGRKMGPEKWGRISTVEILGKNKVSCLHCSLFCHYASVVRIIKKSGLRISIVETRPLVRPLGRTFKMSGFIIHARMSPNSPASRFSARLSVMIRRIIAPRDPPKADRIPNSRLRSERRTSNKLMAFIQAMAKRNPTALKKAPWIFEKRMLGSTSDRRFRYSGDFLNLSMSRGSALGAAPKIEVSTTT